MILPFHSISVDRSAEAAFRRRALKAMPNEHIEALWGYVHDGIAYVCVFMPVKHEGSPEELTYDPAELLTQKRDAHAYRMEVLGSIHTHPDRDETIFSEGDLRELQTYPEMIMAICAIELVEGKRRKCHIAYWPGIKPLKVGYTNWTGKKKV